MAAAATSMSPADKLSSRPGWMLADSLVAGVGAGRAGLCRALGPDQGVDRGPLALRCLHGPRDLFRAPDGQPV